MKNTSIIIIITYAPTVNISDEEKDKFYNKYQEVLNNILRRDLILLTCDMNAHISNDRSGLEQIDGPHGSAPSTNDNGEFLLPLSNISGLCIGKTYFAHKLIHRKNIVIARWENRNRNRLHLKNIGETEVSTLTELLNCCLNWKKVPNDWQIS